MGKGGNPSAPEVSVVDNSRWGCPKRAAPNEELDLKCSKGVCDPRHRSIYLPISTNVSRVTDPAGTRRGTVQ